MERAQRRLSPSGNAGTVPGSTHRRFSRAAGLERGASLRLRRSLPTFSPGRNCRLARGFEAGHRSATGPIGTLISYYGYRYLDTQLGRWLSRDPIGEDDGLNLYAFVGNDPISVKDIYGLLAIYVCTATCWWIRIITWNSGAVTSAKTKEVKTTRNSTVFWVAYWAAFTDGLQACGEEEEKANKINRKIGIGVMTAEIEYAVPFVTCECFEINPENGPGGEQDIMPRPDPLA